MTTIVTRAGKGSPLTNNEVDSNFTNLNTAKIETLTSTDTSVTITGTGSTRDLSVSVGPNVVSGPASATDNAVARFDTTTGKLLQNSVTLIDDTGNASGILSQQFSNGAAVTLAAGKIWYDGSTGAWNAGMGGGNITQQIGEELFVYGKASAAITDSPLQIVYHTGTVGSSGAIKFAPTVAGITDVNAIIGVATESIALNAFGRVTCFGVVHGINTSGSAVGETWLDDDVIWYNPVTGNPTKVKPVAPNMKIQVGIVISAGSGSSGSFQVLLEAGTQLGGTDSNVQITAPTNGNILTYDGGNGYWKNTDVVSGTGISVTKSVNGVLTVTNTSPSSGGTVTSVTGTAPVVSSGGNTPAISMPKATTVIDGYLSAIDWNTFNNKQPAGSYLTAVTASAPLSGSGTAGSPLVISQATTSTNGYLSSTDWNTFNNKQAALVSGTNIKTVNGTSLLGSGDVPVGVLTVTGTAPVVSSGGANPAISMAAANTTTNGYLTSTDWNTFNNKGNGTVTSVSVASANGFTGTSSGGATPALTLATSVTGVLKGNGTAISAANAGTDYSAGTSVLGTGILKSTTTTGALSIAVATDFPTLNQNTTGSAATLTTARNIGLSGDASGSASFNGSADATISATLATVNANTGSFGSSTAIPVLTLDGKGRVTSASTATVAGGQYFGSAAVKAIAYNSNTIAENVTVTAGNNGLSAGPITINTGFTVTVDTGAAWVIV